MDLGQSEDGGFDIQAELHCELPGVDDAKAQELVASAYKVCPYSRATRGNISIKLFAGADEVPTKT